MRVDNSNQEASSVLDKFKWFFVLALIALIVWGNFYFAEPNNIFQPSSIVRIAILVIASLLALLTAFTTKSGKSFFLFAKESRTEVRKVVWPTRKEAVQTTLLIAVITIIVGLALWGIDSLFRSVIFYLTSIGR